MALANGAIERARALNEWGADELPALLAQVRQTLNQSHFPPDAVRSLRLLRITPLMNSVICRCSIVSGTHEERVLVKIFGAPAEAARQQYQTLETLWPRFTEAGTKLKVPRPLGLVAEANALIMEDVTGADLAHLLRRLRWESTRGRDAARLLEAARRSAMWLRRFHGFGVESEPTPLDIGQVLRGAKEDLDQWARYGGSRRFLDKTYEYLRTRLAAFSHEKFRVGYVHGDFKLSNVVVAEDWVAGVDIAIRHRGPEFYDVASFCNSMNLPRLEPLNLLIPPKFLRAWRYAFLQGYYEDGPIPGALIRIFQAISLFSKYLYMCQRHSNPIFQKLYLTPFFKRQVRRFLWDSIPQTSGTV